jgi:YVTN family beta-propeller protein
MPDLSEGAVFAGHRIEGVAGRGGMGTVYRATHLALDHVVALKVIAPDLVTDDSFRERFRSESRIAVSLRHPNVVPIHHAGEEDGLLFVTMDLIEGPDLRKLLIARGPLDGEHAVAILEQVASALDVAHSRGLVHRDIKPGNILIDEHAASDRVFLTDFGLTKRMDQASGATALTSTGAFVGTLDYVAPEQIRGDDLDARTDVYALACVLYEMLTGKAPFADREEKVAKMYAHLQDTPELLTGDKAVFNAVIQRGMAKEPDDRYPSAGDLARAAAAALEGTSVETAERNVGTGPAAPTAAHQTPVETVETVPPLEPTAESEPPFEDTAVSEPQRTEPGPEPEPTQVDPTGVTEAEPVAARRREPSKTRSRTPLLIGGGVLAGIVVAAVIALGGGGGGDDDGGATSAGQTGGGAAEDFAPKVEDGGIDGGQLPVGVAAEGDDVYIADRTGKQLIKGSAADMKPVGEPVPMPDEPEDVAVAGEFVFATVPNADEVIQLNRELGEQAPIALPLDSEPSGMTAADGSIWVSGLGSGDIYKIDPGSSEPDTIELGAQAPFGIAVTDDNLWITDREGDALIRTDRSGGDRTEFTVGDNPKGVAVVNGKVYVANTDGHTVSVLDEANPDKGTTVTVEGLPRAIDVLGDHVWVSNGHLEANSTDKTPKGWVDVFDAGGTEVVKHLEVGGSPEGLGVSGDRVWVATGPTQLARAIQP